MHVPDIQTLFRSLHLFHSSRTLSFLSYLGLFFAFLWIFSGWNQLSVNLLCKFSSECSAWLLHDLPLCLLFVGAVIKYSHAYFHMYLHQKCLLLIAVNLRELSLTGGYRENMKHNRNKQEINRNPIECCYSHKVW